MHDDGITNTEAVLRLYHNAAAGLDGVFVLFATDPKTEKPKPAERFAIGDVRGMAARARALSEVGANVYFSTALVRKDVPKGKRGKLADIAAVLAVVLDDDPDVGKGVTLPPGIVPTIEIITSTKPARNQHLHFILDTPLPPKEGQALAERLHRLCGGDTNGKVITSVWRLPGTMNYPTAVKIKRGRPAEPQPVTLNAAGNLFDPAVVPPEPSEPDAAEPAANHSGHARAEEGKTDDETERQAIRVWLPLWLRKAIEQDTNGDDRSTHAYSVFLGLMDAGLTDHEVRLVADGAPFARKFWERGDLDAEITRERAKWLQAGGETTGGAPKGTARAKPQQGWQTSAPFLLSAKGAIKPLLENAIVALRHAPQWRDVLGYDELAMAVMLTHAPPWPEARVGHNSWELRRWNDNDDRLATAWMQRQGIPVSIRTAVEAVQAVAREAPFHPVRQYLDGLVWGREERCSQLATRYFGAEDSDYHQAVSKCCLIAAVARIMVPGCQVDYMPLFEGGQGVGKSSGVRALFEPCFSDDLSDLGTKDAKMEMQGIWGLEMAELAAMGRAESERYKAFISRRVDRFRPSYGRSIIEAPRQAVMWGTTNQDSSYLKDETGGRRFWPVRCGKRVNVAALKRDKDQIWAEAVHLYRQGEPWWLTDPKVKEVARELQDSRRETDPWEEEIAEHLAKVVHNAPKGEVPCTSVGEIFAKLFSFEEAVGKRTAVDEKRVVRCLHALGWRYGHKGPRPARVKLYLPKHEDDAGDDADDAE